jgi:hypothetical protein
MDELETNNKKFRSFHRDVNEFYKWYQLRNNTVKDEISNLLADPHTALNRWKNFSNQVVNEHGVVILGRWIYVRLRYCRQNLALSKWKLLLET